MKTKKTRKLIRPFWKNFFTDYESARSRYVLSAVINDEILGQETRQPCLSDNPLISGYEKPGRIALSVEREQLAWTLAKIDGYFEAEIFRGNPKKAADLTPKQFAIIELGDELFFMMDYLKAHCHSSLDADAVSSAMTLGAALMRFAIDNPDSPFAKAWTAMMDRNRINSPKGHRARNVKSGRTDEKIAALFTEYKRTASNKSHSYATAENNIATRLGYRNPRKLGKRIRNMDHGMTPAKWYKTL